MAMAPDRGDVAEARALAMLIAGVVAYLICHGTSSPLFVYLPVERAFVWRAPSGAIGMSLFGYIAGAALGALVAGAAAWPRRVAERLASRLAALRWSFVLALAAGFVYFAIVESVRWIA